MFDRLRTLGRARILTQVIAVGKNSCKGLRIVRRLHEIFRLRARVLGENRLIKGEIAGFHEVFSPFEAEMWRVARQISRIPKANATSFTQNITGFTLDVSGFTPDVRGLQANMTSFTPHVRGLQANVTSFAPNARGLQANVTNFRTQNWGRLAVLRFRSDGSKIIQQYNTGDGQ